MFHFTTEADSKQQEGISLDFNRKLHECAGNHFSSGAEVVGKTRHRGFSELRKRQP